MKLFDPLSPAVFLSRPNRFVVVCRLAGRRVRAYLPNPGRLWELLPPGAKLYLAGLPPAPGRSLRHLVVAAERDGSPVMLHTHHTNLVAKHLLEHGLVPGLEHASVVQAEYRIGNSRFDFLLRQGDRNILLEVKSCTLFHRTLAMFPDAISARATKHLLELEELTHAGYDTAVLFVVHAPRARFFMPEHHTDLAFCRALLQVRDRVKVKAVGVGWTRDLRLKEEVRDLAVPWDLVERESHDRGSYLIVLRLDRGRTLELGGLGRVRFGKGYYIYIGAAAEGLTQQLARHQRGTGRKRGHIDHLREAARWIAGIPIRSGTDRECAAADAIARVAGRAVPGFGSTDCRCAGHLFRMETDPLRTPAFIEQLLDLRMGALEKELEER